MHCLREQLQQMYRPIHQKVDVKRDMVIVLMCLYGCVEVSLSSTVDVVNSEIYELSKQLHSLALSWQLMETFQ
jgi:hypothetical protein